MATQAGEIVGALKRGAPSRYHSGMDEEAYNLALLGQTDEEIAETLCVPISTFYRWKAKKRSFREAIARAGARADAEVAAKLRERAMGYSHPAVKIFMPPGASEAVKVDYVEHYPPDVAAASLWLRNRQGGKWRDKTDVQHSGTISLEAWVLEAQGPKQARVSESPAIEHGAIVDDSRDDAADKP